jgi:hypothetical protein
MANMDRRLISQPIQLSFSGVLWGLLCTVMHSSTTCNGRLTDLVNKNSWLQLTYPIRNAWVGGSNLSIGTNEIK